MVDLKQGDCLELMKDIPDKSVDLILTDPPYGINYQSNWRPKGQQFSKIKNDNKPFTDFINLIPRLMKSNGGVFVFTKWNVQQPFVDIMKDNGLNPQNILIWDKVNHGMGDLKRSFGNRYESIIFHSNKDFRFAGKRPTDIIRYTRVSGNKMIHPNEKPVDLLEYLVQVTTSENATVLDCFMGSGSTGAACVNTNRNFIGFELDEHYFEIAKKRIEEAQTALSSRVCMNQFAEAKQL